MVQLTADILLKITPQANHDILNGLIDPLNLYLPQFEITSLLRLDHFLAQAAEETDGFRTLTEYASGHEYEGRQDLGNTEPGDGPRFKGRGIFQLTGRANYSHMSQILGIDLVSNPELAQNPDVAVHVACLYWQGHALNALADQDNLEAITRRINGGTNGLETRELYADRADKALSPFFPAS